MKLCPKCGNLVPEDANFCPICGYPLQGNEQQSPSANPISPQQPPFQPPYNQYQSSPQQPKKKNFPLIPVLGAVVATIAILIVVVVVFPSFGSNIYVVQPSFLNSEVGGNWHVDKNMTFVIKISDFKAVVSFANGTTLTFTSETAFVQYIESHRSVRESELSFSNYETYSLSQAEGLISNVSLIKVEVLNSTGGQYAEAGFLKVVPDSHYASELEAISSFLALAASFNQGQNISTYYNQKLDAIGYIKPTFNGYNVTVLVINTKSFEVGALFLFINHPIKYTQLANLVNSFASSMKG
ncbi:zinc ribbon domain-containing protein [Acidianus sp. RZ1]|uniref:zinc-ribbon domain-containing protein n=1 Tax=Acidianus sp. RZ1 TaxID=1540082 RepID=UPI0014919293|nr:zinc ribbon domain-containing protein [Acidianus sp. RZ1]NON62770.1 zinc-ribbon domain-containing protein [Acidianus sp. RZ1]